MTRAPFVVTLVLLLAGPVAAAPRDELLRVAPTDTAIVIVVQNARDHYRNLSESPFVQWFPTTAIGKKLLESADLKQLRESAAMIFAQLGTTPDALIDDVLGDAVGFAYSPGPPGRPGEERALILVRPRKPDALQKLLDRVNELQTKSGELKGIARKEHAGATYFERQKPEGASEFYCFRGDVFAFSPSEADVKAFIDRDKAEPPVSEKAPELVARMRKLGVADAAAVVLINPRPLDAEVKARVAAARPDEKRFLTKFAEVWAGLDSAAVYLVLDRHLELGVSLRFQPDKLPADAKKWLAAFRERSAAGHLIPKDALFGVAGHFRAADLIDLVAALAPVEPGKPGVKEWIDQALGSVIDRDKLSLILNALGPDWAIWAEPPVKGAYLPTLVAAIEISGEPEDRAKAEKALLEALDFGFRMARFAYNAKHADQVELKEEKDPKTGAVIKSLVSEKGFPPGFRPSFAVVKGYLVLATSPEAIKRFEPPAPANPVAPGHTTLAKLSGTRTREYLLVHGPKLAKTLADLGVGDEKKLAEHIEALAGVLELVESAEVITRPDENGLQIAVRVYPAKPLKK
jgi:hypothetical protein